MYNPYEFRRACKAGDLEKVKNLIEYAQEIIPDPKGIAAFHLW